MLLDRVTITGADDSIAPGDLLPLSARFPFVEWGILVSRSQIGSPRFPSQPWLDAVSTMGDRLALSLHVCGRLVRDLLVGVDLPADLVAGYGRVQLNFHAERTECYPPAFGEALSRLAPRQVIFQLDGAHGNTHMSRVRSWTKADCVGLFDVSGGAGVLPQEWPAYDRVWQRAYLGFAGGLGPDNLAREIPRIAQAAGHARAWIDMETRVRSDGDRLFDLAKVERCLEIAAPFVSAAT